MKTHQRGSQRDRGPAVGGPGERATRPPLVLDLKKYVIQPFARYLAAEAIFPVGGWTKEFSAGNFLLLLAS